CFIVFTAWMLAESRTTQRPPGFYIAIISYVILAALLILQPDFGMTITVSTVWAGQLFLSGLSLIWIAVCMVLGLIGIFLAYMFLPHVTYRIDSFIASAGGGNYQVSKSLEAFHNGGLLGRGPGEGTVKQSLPDS